MSKVKCQVSDTGKGKNCEVKPHHHRSRKMSPVWSIIISTARPSRGWAGSGWRDRPGRRARRCSPSPRSSAIMWPGDNTLTHSCHHQHCLRILEELLMDYDQTERPPSKGWLKFDEIGLWLKSSHLCSGPTDVKVSILIRSMGPISDTDMVSCQESMS